MLKCFEVLDSVVNSYSVVQCREVLCSIVQFYSSVLCNVVQFCAGLQCCKMLYSVVKCYSVVLYWIKNIKIHFFFKSGTNQLIFLVFELGLVSNPIFFISWFQI